MDMNGMNNFGNTGNSNIFDMKQADGTHRTVKLDNFKGNLDMETINRLDEEQNGPRPGSAPPAPPQAAPSSDTPSSPRAVDPMPARPDDPNAGERVQLINCPSCGHRNVPLVMDLQTPGNTFGQSVSNLVSNIGFAYLKGFCSSCGNHFEIFNCFISKPIGKESGTNTWEILKKFSAFLDQNGTDFRAYTAEELRVQQENAEARQRDLNSK